jgi:hypothetical protein
VLSAILQIFADIFSFNIFRQTLRQLKSCLEDMRFSTPLPFLVVLVICLVGEIVTAQTDINNNSRNVAPSRAEPGAGSKWWRILGSWPAAFVLIFLIFYLVRFTTTQGRTPTLIRVDFR